MTITDYGKMVFIDLRDGLVVCQPKSFTMATREDRDELLDLLLKGEYRVISVAIPTSTLINYKGAKGEKE